MKVAKTTQYDGDIFRQPKLYSSILKRTKQEGMMSYNTYIKVLNPNNLSQSKDVGKWVGDVKVDPTTGAYDLVQTTCASPSIRSARRKPLPTSSAVN